MQKISHLLANSPQKYLLYCKQEYTRKPVNFLFVCSMLLVAKYKFYLWKYHFLFLSSWFCWYAGLFLTGLWDSLCVSLSLFLLAHVVFFFSLDVWGIHCAMSEKGCVPRERKHRKYWMESISVSETWDWLFKCTHVHARTHTHAHTRTHTHTHTHHTHTHNTHTHTYTRTHERTHARMHAHTHTYTHTHTHTHTQRTTHTHTYTRTHERTHATHARTHTRTAHTPHTYTHTHAHTHTHTHVVFYGLWGTLHRRNGFYTVQTVCAIALHLPYT